MIVSSLSFPSEPAVLACRSSSSSSATVTPTPRDVCCGRGKRVQNHPGNARYRQLVRECVQCYVDAPSRGDKSDIVNGILESIKRNDGRFLKQQENDGWVEMNDEAARLKVGHTIRDFCRRKNNHSSAASAIQSKKQQIKSNKPQPASSKKTTLEKPVMACDTRPSETPSMTEAALDARSKRGVVCTFKVEPKQQKNLEQQDTRRIAEEWKQMFDFENEAKTICRMDSSCRSSFNDDAAASEFMSQLHDLLDCFMDDDEEEGERSRRWSREFLDTGVLVADLF